MITLKTAIIHSFKKLAKTSFISDVVKKDVVLNTENPALQFLVNGIHGLIGKEGNSVVYGQFANDERQGPFPRRFTEFVATQDDEDQFIDLTHLAMDQLVEQAGLQVLSTGGHILCAQYSSGASNFFLVASMKERGGIQLDENYVPKEIQEVDLNKVQQAARINLGSFVAIQAMATATPQTVESEAVEEADSTYLCFISRGRDSQASDYFISALGCAKGVASGRATKNAIDNVAKFFRDKKSLKSFGYRAKEAVIKYLETQLAAGKSARLDSIVHAAVAHVPADLVDEIAGLKDYLNSEKNKVPDDFTVNAKTLKEKTRIKGDASNWSLQFERGALGKDPAADVYYDEGRKKLTLSNMTTELIDVIEKELLARSG
ncbi:MAG: nucleoid-associated protein [Pseudomonas fluorescens]|jgi:nucleoid-associated protein|uniref:nucleoid-associated protein n=1 Tax=Pseudomonas sp. AM8 TaxID=2983368 RepID=UPI002E81546F|nr:nucleoid-associated protein [Pseudomonas sp. AM8]